MMNYVKKGSRVLTKIIYLSVVVLRKNNICVYILLRWKYINLNVNLQIFIVKKKRFFIFSLYLYSFMSRASFHKTWHRSIYVNSVSKLIVISYEAKRILNRLKHLGILFRHKNNISQYINNKNYFYLLYLVFLWD